MRVLRAIMALVLTVGAFVGSVAVATATPVAATSATPKFVVPHVSVPHGTANSADCVSRSWCMIVDQTGAAIVYANGVASAPTAVSAAGLSSVSCVSKTFCMATSFARGRVYKYNGTSWTAKSIAHVSYLKGVSCVSASFCLAVGYYAVPNVSQYGVVSRWNGSNWGKVTHLGSNPLSSVSCVSSTFCAAVADDGTYSSNWAATWNGKTWKHKLEYYELTAVSCVSKAFCVTTAVGPDPNTGDLDGGSLTWNGRKWGAHKSFGNVLTGMSCTAVTSCIATDGGYPTWWHYNGTKWVGGEFQESSEYDGLGAVSCFAPTFCIVVDELGEVYRWNGSAWSSPGFGESTAAVHCDAPASCIGVDADYAVTAFDGHAYRVLVAGRRNGALQHVTCTTDSLCVGIEEADNSIRRFDGSSWSQLSVTALDFPGAVSCASLDLCVATGQYYDGTDEVEGATVYDGSSWSSPHRLTAMGAGATVSCAGSHCLVVGYAQSSQVSWSRYTTGAAPAWTSPAGITGVKTYAALLWCGTSGGCALTASDVDRHGWCTGFTSTFDGAHWTPPTTVKRLGTPTSISCASAAACAVVGTGIALEHNGVWDTTAFGAPDGVAAEQAACASATYCVFAGYGATVVVDDNAWTVVDRVDPYGGLSAVSCPSASDCIAVGYAGEATRYNGSGWSRPQVVDLAGWLDTVSCPTGSFCAAGDESRFGGQVLTFDGSTWSDPAVSVRRPGRLGLVHVEVVLHRDRRDVFRVHHSGHASTEPPGRVLRSCRTRTVIRPRR